MVSRCNCLLYHSHVPIRQRFLLFIVLLRCRVGREYINSVSMQRLIILVECFPSRHYFIYTARNCDSLIRFDKS